MEKETYNFLLTEINKYLEVSEIIQEINNDTVYSAKDFDYTIVIKDDLDNTLESLQLQPLQRKIVFLIAKYQNGGTGVSTQFLVNNANENSTPGSISNSINRINNASQKFFYNEDFKLITKSDQSHFLINGKKVEDQRSFTIDDFFDVFSKYVSTIKFGDSFSNIDDLNFYEKYKVLFTLLDADIAETNLELLYARNAKWINETYCLEVFSQLRMRLKGLLNNEEVFSEEYKSLSSDEFTEPLKGKMNDFINEMQTKWRKEENNLFPRDKADKYYKEHRSILFETISSKEIDINFDFNWVSPFLDYTFSNEDECIDIDDIIVSFALLALSNYKIGNESALLQKAREKYRTAVEKLIHERFGPSDNNHQDIKDAYVDIQWKQSFESQMRIDGIPEEYIGIVMGSLRKVYKNENIYFNEDNDHNMTR